MSVDARSGMRARATSQGELLYCAAVEGTCVAQEAGVLLGSNIGASLLSFIVAAEEGARLILQRNREGFSIQVTDPVERSTDGPLDIEELKAWHEKLSATRRKA